MSTHPSTLAVGDGRSFGHSFTEPLDETQEGPVRTVSAIQLGTSTFAEVRDQMTLLAADIARERKLSSGDYRAVLRDLKREALEPDAILPYYKQRLTDIERIIEQAKLISLPKRPATIRLATEAESAAIPAPYFSVPRLIGNKGEVGEFVLPLSNPNSKSGARPDDFTSPAAAWRTSTISRAPHW